jgi:hypothetical protein
MTMSGATHQLLEVEVPLLLQPLHHAVQLQDLLCRLLQLLQRRFICDAHKGAVVIKGGGALANILLLLS